MPIPDVLEKTDLELFLEDEHEIRCEATITKHGCLVEAKWLCYATNACSRTKQAVVPWCQARYNYWLKQCEWGTTCACTLPCSHYTVLPI
jgi:hypothetical protein